MGDARQVRNVIVTTIMSYEGAAVSSGKEPVVKHVIVQVAEVFEELQVPAGAPEPRWSSPQSYQQSSSAGGAAGGIRA